MGIRPSLSPVYEKDPKTGTRVLKGFKGTGQTYSQTQKGVQPKQGFGVDTPKQKQTTKIKAMKQAEIQEKVIKHRTPRKAKKTSA